MTPHPNALTGNMLIPLAQKLKESIETVMALIHCERCGTGKDVQIISTGSVGRITPLCPSCLAAIQQQDKDYWEEYDSPSSKAARHKILKRPGLFARLFSRKH